MKCSFCGKELEPGSGFCPNCGTMMSVDGDFEENTAVTDEQKYEPDRDDVYSNVVAEEEPANTQPVDEDVSVPEYVPAKSRDDLVTVGADDVDDPFDALHEDEKPQKTVSDDDGDDMYLKPKGSKKGGVAIALLVIALVAVIAVGVNVIRNNGSLPVFNRTTQNSSQSSSGETEKQTKETKEDKTKTTKETKSTEETKTTKETTEKTTKKDGKTETSAEKETTKEKTTAASTTRTSSTSAATSTTRAASTTAAPSTTRTASTTAAPATTSTPSTTAAPTTTASVSKPSSYYSSPVTRYISQDGVSLRKAASASSAARLYLSVGNDVKVYAQEGGFSYVYSPRYGLYGWVRSSYLSKSRPVAESESKVSGVVSPDQKYQTAKSATVGTSDGLRLRKGPGTSYDVIRMIGGDYPLKVIGTSSKNPGWVYVYDITHGVSGWVSSQYIKY